MKRKLFKFLFFIVLLLSPFLVVTLYVENKENPYQDTYLAELKDKYELLKNTEEKKIIFVGGSSLPFGLRSDLIEQELKDYKVINFGLYATLGTKLMMDLSKVNISEGDIVILSPELNSQTYSLYFNSEAVLQALDGFTSHQRHLSFQNNLSLIYGYRKFANDKLRYIKEGGVNATGIYHHDSFNQYGDIEVDRPQNIMNNGVDSTMDIYTDETLLNQDFIEYINQYVHYIHKRKAKIYFSFPPCNELAMKSSKQKRAWFMDQLSVLLECDLLLNLEKTIMNAGYFYDTNFHLNSSGAIYYSSALIDAIKLKLNREVNGSSSSPEDPDDPSSGGDIVIPTPPDIKDDPVVEPDNPTKVEFENYTGEPNNDFLDVFTYRLVGSSYQITGVKDDYKDIEEVILPSTYNGKNIATITKNCFYGCINLKKIHIGKTYKVFEEESFNGCIALEGIYLYELDGNTISPAANGLLTGCNRDVRIYVLENANYLSGYTWSNYKDKFSYFKRG